MSAEVVAAGKAAGPDRPPWYRRVLKAFGPGLVTGASDDDPSGIATYSQAGAQFGFAISWTMLLSYPLMTAIQEISARIGRTTGRGIAGNIRKCYPGWLLHIIVALLVIANTINIGADLSAMGDAVNFLVGGPQLLHVVVLAAICATLQIFVSYARYASALRWLSLALFAYFATVMTVNVPWSEVARGLLIPTLSSDAKFWTMVVAILGTTISPYLFFWQASQEVEDLRASPERKTFKQAPHQVPDAIERIRIDTWLGMAFSNLVALAIIITTAATLHASGVTDIQTSADAAKALEPVAGRFASIVFALGIMGTGLLAVPVLAGSAGYALGEAFKWPVGLERRPGRAKGFYATIALATMIGAALNFMAFSPMKALFWSAVINGVVSAPVMVVMMLIAGNRTIMGKFPVTGTLRHVGWAATATMALAALTMLVTAFL
jgi:NRAMP (natural resistance-associated macrophage protein)-like metal ion transporter